MHYARTTSDLRYPVVYSGESVHITTKVVSSNLAHSEVFSIQHYVIKFLSKLAADRWFTQSTPVSSTNRTDRHAITEIVWKWALNTITPYPVLLCENNFCSKCPVLTKINSLCVHATI